MLDPTLHTALCAALESAINAALRYDPGSRQALGKLDGQVLAVETTQPSATFYLIPRLDSPETESLGVQSYWEGEVSARLKGSPPALASLLKSEGLNLAEAGVEVFGNTGLLIEWQRIARNLDIDWEEAISQILGDVVGHEAATRLRGFSAWLDGRKATFERLLGEYLSEELKATPARAELEKYYRDVDQLRLATDRLVARIDALAARQAD
ncbi:MAG: hypothetical protein WDZ30_00160 [Cellvibrionaceae bacterium]